MLLCLLGCLSLGSGAHRGPRHQVPGGGGGPPLGSRKHLPCGPQKASVRLSGTCSGSPQLQGHQSCESSSSRLSRGSGGNSGARDTCPSSASKLGEAPCFHVPESGLRGAPTKPLPLVGAPHVGLGSHVLSFSNHLSLGLILNIYIFLESCPFHWSKMYDSSCTG